MEKLQLTFNKIYQTRYKIGETASAKVYLGIDTSNDDKEVAVKLEPRRMDNRLEHEAKILKVLKGNGVPQLYWFGRQHDFDVLVTDLLGPSLEQLYDYCEKRFTLKTTIMIAEQLLDRLQSIHAKKLVYCDIRPMNFLVGLGAKTDKIFVVDFEKTRGYVDEEGNHKALRESNIQTGSGNELFLSIHAHMGIGTLHNNAEQSRRDDLQSLGYMLIYFLKGYLPWQNMIADSQTKLNLLVKEKKVSIPVELLCEGLPKQFELYFNYVKSLEFEEEPDYVWLRRLFRDLGVNTGLQLNLIFDWAERHHQKR